MRDFFIIINAKSMHYNVNNDGGSSIGGILGGKTFIERRSLDKKNFACHSLVVVVLVCVSGLVWSGRWFNSFIDIDN